MKEAIRGETTNLITLSGQLYVVGPNLICSVKMKTEEPRIRKANQVTRPY